MNLSEAIHITWIFLSLFHHSHAICSTHTLERNTFLIRLNEIGFIQLTHHVRQPGLIYLSEVTQTLSTCISPVIHNYRLGFAEAGSSPFNLCLTLQAVQRQNKSHLTLTMLLPPL